MPIKIAFAAICKPDAAEALLLDQCLASVKDHVDGIFITQAGPAPDPAVSKVIKKYKGVESFYKWDFNFANARNFNFAQVPEDYDYILWLDADDTIENPHLLRNVIEQNPAIDLYAFWYNYGFDEWGNPIVVHQKTRVIRNDGCVSWAGALHEDFKHNRTISTKFVEGIEVIHHSEMARIIDAKSRNLEVAQRMVTDLPSDPRSYWNLAQSQIGAYEYEDALKTFAKFLEMSESNEEKYIARLRCGESLWALQRKQAAIDEIRAAIGLKPDYPDAYIRLGEYLYHTEKFADAISILKQAITLKPPYHSIVVFNPMEYKYTPLKWLGYSYMAMSLPLLAHDCFKMLLQMTPQDKQLQDLVELIGAKAEEMERMLVKYNEIKDMDKLGLMTELAALPKEYQCHPMFVNLRNVNFPKTTSTGKEIAYVCGFTEREWDADAVKEGIGGSEEAVINLAKEWTKAGYQVTVYNNCGSEEKVMDGVIYRPFYTFNYRDKHDTVVLWRSPKLLDYDINAKTILVDLHDVVSDVEFNRKRMAKVSKIFVKSKFHRDLFPNVPDEKFVIVPNGIVAKDFEKKVKRERYLMVNTSSPDRSLSALVRLFKRVKEQVPEARCEWAYGWSVYDAVHKNNPGMMAWKEEMLDAMDEVGIRNLGRLSHSAIRDMYLRGRVFAYPTEFAEIDCISARKAQAAGCLPITTDFAALGETVRHGVKIKSKKTKDDWCPPGVFEFGITDPAMEDKWVDAVVAELRTPYLEDKEMREDMKQFDWSVISSQWTENFA